MARKVKMSAGILNIRLHPHSRDRYLSFVKALFGRRRAAQVHGDRYGMISTLDTRREGTGILDGIFTTFLKFDLDGNWFNSAELKEADDELIAEINIPEGVYPSAISYYFEWDANSHKLYFQQYTKGKTLTPNSAKKFAEHLVADLAITTQFGLAKVSIVQKANSLDRLFALKRINEIHITLLRPNPDVFSDDFEQRIEEHLEQTHSRKMVVSYDAEPGQSVVPTAGIRAVSEAALDNGKVDVVGRDDSGAVRLSTEDFPVVLHSQFDPDEMNEQTAFRRLVAESKPRNPQ